MHFPCRGSHGAISAIPWVTIYISKLRAFWLVKNRSVYRGLWSSVKQHQTKFCSRSRFHRGTTWVRHDCREGVSADSCLSPAACMEATPCLTDSCLSTAACMEATPCLGGRFVEGGHTRKDQGQSSKFCPNAQTGFKLFFRTIAHAIEHQGDPECCAPLGVYRIHPRILGSPKIVFSACQTANSFQLWIIFFSNMLWDMSPKILTSVCFRSKDKNSCESFLAVEQENNKDVWCFRGCVFLIDLSSGWQTNVVRVMPFLCRDLHRAASKLINLFSGERTWNSTQVSEIFFLCTRLKGLFRWNHNRPVTKLQAWWIMHPWSEGELRTGLVATIHLVLDHWRDTAKPETIPKCFAMPFPLQFEVHTLLHCGNRILHFSRLCEFDCTRKSCCAFMGESWAKVRLALQIDPLLAELPLQCLLLPDTFLDKKFFHFWIRPLSPQIARKSLDQKLKQSSRPTSAQTKHISTINSWK